MNRDKYVSGTSKGPQLGRQRFGGSIQRSPSAWQNAAITVEGAAERNLIQEERHTGFAGHRACQYGMHETPGPDPRLPRQ